MAGERVRRPAVVDRAQEIVDDYEGGWCFHCDGTGLARPLWEPQPGTPERYSRPQTSPVRGNQRLMASVGAAAPVSILPG